MRLDLQSKLLMGLLLPLLLVAGLFLWLSLWQSETSSQVVAEQDVVLAAERRALALASQLDRIADRTRQTAAVFAVHPPSGDEPVFRGLELGAQDLPAVQATVFAGLTPPVLYQLLRNNAGLQRQSRPLKADFGDAPEWLQMQRAHPAAIWSPPHFEAAGTPRWLMTYSAPVLIGGALAGVVATDVPLAALAALPEADAASGDGLLLVDARGRILASTNAALLSRPFTDWAAAGTRGAALLMAESEPAPVLVDWPVLGARLTARTAVPGTDWKLLYGQTVQALPAGVSALRIVEHHRLLLVLAASVLLALWASWLLRRQLKPLRLVAAQLDHYSRTGSAMAVPASKSAETTGSDEVGRLAAGLESLQQAVQAREQNLVQRQRELADRNREQQVLYKVAEILGWIDLSFTDMLRRVAELLPEAWPAPENLSCRVNLGEFRAESEPFEESPRGLFAPVQVEGGSRGGVWVFALDDASPLEAGQQDLLEGVAQQLGLAYRRERAQDQLEKLNRELERRVEARTDALRKAERLLRDITNSMPGAVYQTTQRPPKPMELSFVSAGIDDVFGVPREQALANYDALMGLVHPEDLSNLTAASAAAITDRRAFIHSYRINHAVSHEVRWIQSAANPVVDKDGTVTLNGYWIDVTEQKQLELELEQARQEANAASDAKSRFLANMSHEIRTPMNAIIGLTHLAHTQSAEPKVRDQLSKVEGAARTLLGLLNDILDFSKIEAGRLNVERIPFDLWTVLDQVQSLMSDRAAEKGLLFTVWRVPELPRDLIGDPLRLNQVLLNLVSNAVKFTTEGSVTLNVTVIGRETHLTRIRFEVQDTGVGIDPIQLTRLFSAFTQADSSTTRRFGGTGLGLTISKELVTLMGGEIRVDSVPGAGSVFSVTLPFDHADPAWRQEDVQPVGDAQDPLKDAKVLLVDDNIINLEVASELLKQSGVLVTTAVNGREALEKIEQGRYDAVLMDLQMPEMDGLTATERLRMDARYTSLPVIAMTANAMAGDRERCLAAGMNDHIPKPIAPEELRTTLGRWLRRSRADLTATIPPAS